MLRIRTPEVELYDEDKNEFTILKSRVIAMEHSLVSISKWESKWKKPFLENRDKTREEVLHYLQCMTITQNVPPQVYLNLSEDNIKEIQDYIEDPMTATTFRDEGKGGGSRAIITSELIYYWMVALEIPMECQKWHLNRLLTLINICRIKNDPDKSKMSKNAIRERNRALNEARKKKYKTKG